MEARCGQHVEGGQSDLGVVMIGERVVEDQHIGGGLDARYLSSLAPLRESLEGSSPESGQSAAAVEAEHPLVQMPGRKGIDDPIRERGEEAPPSSKGPRISQHPRLEGGAVTVPVVGKELALETGDVDADRALGLARTAFETQVERLVHAVVAKSRLAEPPGDRQSKHVGPPACRMLFVARHHVGRAHGPFEGLPADAEAAAHFHRAGHPAVVGVVEVRLERSRRVSRAKPEIGRQRGSVDDLAWIEDPVRVEGVFDRAERFVELGPEHLAHERAPHEPVSVLARECATVLQDQIGDVVGDRFEHRDAGLGLQVDDRTHVKAADRRMCVDSGGGTVRLHDRDETLDIGAKLLRGHSGVFDEGEGFGVALHGHGQAERCLAQAPHLGLRGRVGGMVVAVAQPRVTQVALERLQAWRQVLRPVAIELHAQQRLGISLDEALSQRMQSGALTCVIEDEPVHHLYGRRRVAEDERRGGRAIRPGCATEW